MRTRLTLEKRIIVCWQCNLNSIAIEIDFTANNISVYFLFVGKFPVLFHTVLYFVTEFLILNYVLFWAK